MDFNFHHFHHFVQGESVPTWAKQLMGQMETVMIDTKRLLAEVAAERTELASWKALSVAKDKVISDQATALADAIANNDQEAIAQVQKDLDQAASDLAADNAEADAFRAVTANLPPPTSGAPAPTPTQSV